ncbi:hypothetical protein K501DRAFT_323465 [Backusella circina FSU 941]|nr:hypothetical protein K501DRAFT_323465 [Backusella circina FSU 941]
MACILSFEPKDPRIIIADYWYSSDEEDEGEECNTSETAVIDGKPRKRKTGTQALVEFLNTTSPEEFQKLTTKRTSSFFRRKTKNNPAVNARVLGSTNQGRASPYIARRKNYIEILASPLKEAMKSSQTLSSHPSLVHKVTASRSNSGVGHINNSNISSINGNSNSASKNGNHSGMILPLPYKASVKREPSLYSIQRSIHPRQDHDQTGQVGNDAGFIIEQALLQRLQQNQRNSNETPGEVVTDLLANEHIRALNILAEQEKGKTKEEDEEKVAVKKRVRHVQVQTSQWKEESTDILNAVNDVSASTSPIIDNENLLKRLEIAEMELKKERRTRQKLEATLMEATDHFEVLSGLAYLKLRELWEEKLHWENAYIDVKEQSWREHQKVNNELTSSDEGLSLDESYLDETNMYQHYPQVR